MAIFSNKKLIRLIFRSALARIGLLGCSIQIANTIIIIRYWTDPNEISDIAYFTAIAYTVSLLISAFIIANNIVIPINKLILFLKRASTGDLTRQLDMKHQNEVGYIMHSLNKTIDSLAKLIKEIENEALQVSRFSEPLLQQSDTLNHQAENLASSIQEVSSSLETMADHISANNNNAEQTKEESQQALAAVINLQKLALKGTESSNNIQQKVQIIKEIADQTNLLALNAAIEASRAGEHGKGFAIVAKEIRKLAELSKTSANEIMDISANRLQLSIDIENHINKIIDKIEISNGHMNEVSISAKEQKSSVDFINASISSLNKVSVSNKQSVNKLTVQSKDFDKISKKLRAIISSFNLPYT